jgi:hypothetical protein
MPQTMTSCEARNLWTISHIRYVFHPFLGYWLQINDANPQSHLQAGRHDVSEMHDARIRGTWIVDIKPQFFPFLNLQGFRVGQSQPQRVERTQVHHEL